MLRSFLVLVYDEPACRQTGMSWSWDFVSNNLLFVYISHDDDFIRRLCLIQFQFLPTPFDHNTPLQNYTNNLPYFLQYLPSPDFHVCSLVVAVTSLVYADQDKWHGYHPVKNDISQYVSYIFRHIQICKTSSPSGFRVHLQ